MKTVPSLFALAIAAALSGPASALYKCETKDGIVYQDRVCQAGGQTMVAIVVPTFGESPRKPHPNPKSAVVPTAKADQLVTVPVYLHATPAPKDAPKDD